MSRDRRLIAALGLTLALTSCARAPVAPELEVGNRRQRYDLALARRSRPAGCEADVLAWARWEQGRSLPGVQARLLAAFPDAVRIRVGSWFGAAIDVAAHGDSLTVLIPRRRAVLETPDVSDSLGVADAGGLSLRILGGLWAPPATAWGQGAMNGSELILSWDEGHEAMRLAVDALGLPSWVERSRGARTWVVEYHSWNTWQGIRWPSRFSVRDSSTSLAVDVRLERIQFRDQVPRDRLRIVIPEDAERFTFESLRRALELAEDS